jgi:hypothetical protein
MSDYSWSICEPDQSKVIEKGSIRKDKILETFDQFPWIDRLRKVAGMNEDDVCFSPSLGFKNPETGQGVEISIVGTEENYEFYIFYQRPAAVRVFGLFKKNSKHHLSDIAGQTKDDVIKFLSAFLNNDSNYMEAAMKNK